MAPCTEAVGVPRFGEEGVEVGGAHADTGSSRKNSRNGAVGTIHR
jgi:hypothetical protein